jgi:hypothetical protein
MGFTCFCKLWIDSTRKQHKLCVSSLIMLWDVSKMVNVYMSKMILVVKIFKLIYVVFC